MENNVLFINNLSKTLCKQYNVNSIDIPEGIIKGGYTRQQLLPLILNLVIDAAV